jgi:lipoprotein-releasing system ATP-binding protein
MMADQMTPALELRQVARAYRQGEARLEIFTDVSLQVLSGQVTALVGPSGAGKSSLLHIAGLLEAPTAGEVFIAGKNCSALPDLARTRIRRLGIGFVYQFHHLLPEFSALENVALPQRAAARPRGEAEARARTLLDQVGLSHRLGHRPAELSGGEQQRVAFARALANAPALLLADEPTGNLDPDTSEVVFDAMMRLVREAGLAALVATHNPALAARMDRVLRLDHGRLVPQA